MTHSHTGINRRRFIQIMAAGCACCTGSVSHARLLDYQLMATEIASKTWAVHGATEYFNMGNGGNIVNVAFIEVPDGIVVIDSGPSRRYGEALLSLIENTAPGKPILRVYNTHHHPDHFLGNQVFDPGIIAAPEKVIENINVEGNAFADNMYRLVGDWMRGTKVVAPGLALSDAKEEVGGRQFSLFYLAGHTSADFVIRDDETGVLFSGDLAFLFRAPTTPHADINTWQQAIDTLAATDRSLILPGHGLRDETGESLEQTSDYLSWLNGTLNEAVSFGYTMNEAMALPIPKRFDTLSVVRTEFERSVVHLYPALEESLFPLVDVNQ